MVRRFICQMFITPGLLLQLQEFLLFMILVIKQNKRGGGIVSWCEYVFLVVNSHLMSCFYRFVKYGGPVDGRRMRTCQAAAVMPFQHSFVTMNAAVCGFSPTRPPPGPLASEEARAHWNSHHCSANWLMKGKGGGGGGGREGEITHLFWLSKLFFFFALPSHGMAVSLQRTLVLLCWLICFEVS